MDKIKDKEKLATIEREMTKAREEWGSGKTIIHYNDDEITGAQIVIDIRFDNN